MVKVGIVGATGYGGNELVRLLLSHQEAKIVWLSSRSYAKQQFSEIYGSYFNIVDDELISDDLENYLDQVDVVFFATPHGVASKMITKEMLEKVKVIDLSADYRLDDKDTYEQWYQCEHPSWNMMDEAVFGLCEINRDQIKNARLLANPGCYPTCSSLSLYPLVKAGLIETDTIIIDALSGTSGAGRSAKVDNLFCEVNESVKAYGIATHRHTPEIEMILNGASADKFNVTFTPHLLPINRGILTTSYATLKGGVSQEDVVEAYKMYDQEQFLRVLKNGVYPEIRNVRCSNYIDINFKIDIRCNRIIVVGAMDNLVKGAAGQAIQNMNIMFDIEESMGIDQAPNSL